MPRKPGPGVRVRGTCAAGHTTEAMSDPGRVTWEGRCSHKGCELPVKGRRIPGPPPAAPKTEPKSEKTPATGTRKLIVTKEPTNAPKHPKPATGQQPVPGPTGAGDPAAGEPAGVPAGGPGSPAGGLVTSTGDPGPHHSSTQARGDAGKWRSSLAAKLKARRERERRTDEPDWIPGIIR
jgi:hypothetical protein